METKKEISRYDVDPKIGLSNEQVQQRKEEHLDNKTKIVVGKSYTEIIISDLFSFFNIVLFSIFILCMIGRYFSGIFFMGVLICNIGISLYEDIKARHLMSKLRVLSAPKGDVLRNGKEEAINVEEIVLDDVVCLKSESQIAVDGPLIEGELLVNESQLTGESVNVAKKVGDILYSGSFVVSGKGKMLADKVGMDSYIEQLSNKAKKFKRSPSEILKSLRYLFRVLGTIVIVMAIAIFAVYGIKGELSSYEAYCESIQGISGSLISMIPSGLYLLTSAALAVAVINLAQKNARVQDFYSIEMLARTNVLCVDKTGTITDGSMKVCGVIKLNQIYSDEDIAQIVSNVIQATNDDNFTAKALKEYFTYGLTKGVVSFLSFNSDNKYSAATFTGDETYAIGANSFLNLSNALIANKRVEEQTSKGNRVLVLAKSHTAISNNQINGPMEAIALIILQDHIREAAPRTFKWFKENDVKVKVISGDDPQTVSVVAMEAGVEGGEKYISLAGLTDEQVKEAALNYNVFGRVNPEQKEIIIQTLKDNKNTVAMTGDGVNDILALKRADCSIAMASGSEAAKNVSHIVLLDSNFDSLPSVVDEGRRVINNLQRAASLFLVKTTFSVVSTIVFLILLITNGIKYPFYPTHFYVWEIATLGLPAFFLALQKNSERIKGHFLKNVLMKAAPAGITVCLAVATIYILYAMQISGVYTGVYTFEAATSMSVLAFIAIGLAALFKICMPFDKYRAIVFGGSSLLAIGWVVVDALWISKTNFFFQLYIDYQSMNPVNYAALAVVLIVYIALYFVVTYIIEVCKGEHLDVKDQSRSRSSDKRK